MIFAVVDIFEYTPWIVNLKIIEQIAVIPFLYFLNLLFLIIVCEHRLHFFLRKTKSVSIACVKNAVRL